MTGPVGAVPRVGPMSGRGVIGETTESLHRFLLDGYDLSEQPPRFEEDLKFVPKDREEVIYIYMYRVAQNPNLQRSRRHQQAPIYVNTSPEEGGEVYFHRPPILVDLFYIVMVHSKFRSDAERLLGWLMLRLNEATHLIYRPRRFVLPDGREVDSLGRSYDPDVDPDEDGLLMQKVSLALVDDLTVGDAINLYSLHEAPYRPFLTYRARVALDGALVESSGGTTIRMGRLENAEAPRPGGTSPNGRIRGGHRPNSKVSPPGPDPHFMRRSNDAETED